MRESGILLHITSLPSRYGIGDLGKGSFDMADLLSATGQGLWQILPLNPTDRATGNSPYSSPSAFAMNPSLISPDTLYEKCLLCKGDLDIVPELPEDRCDYDNAVPFKAELLRRAYARFTVTGIERQEFEKFCERHAGWLDDFALFMIIKREHGGAVWNNWPDPLKHRDPKALEEFSGRYRDAIEMEKYFQFLAFSQWYDVKRYCNARDIRTFGDIPIYVSYDSADVWTNPMAFRLDGSKNMVSVAGVPPDYFSNTGQNWGNPVYNWEHLKQTGFDWWIKRLRHNFSLFDLLRIDHFRGLVDYWEIPAGEETAVNGKWSKVPYHDLFDTLKMKFGALPIVAEDLGMLSAESKKAMVQYGFPGMKVLLFAFGEDLEKHPYLPHNYQESCVAYTGTHDNNTVRGWFEHEASRKEKDNFFDYIGKEVTPENCAEEAIGLIMASDADRVIIPMQDLLGLGQEARMNRPGTSEGNWGWRLSKDAVTAETREFLAELTDASERLQ